MQPIKRRLVRLQGACQILNLSRNGFDLLRKRDPDFPKGMKMGETRQAPVFFDVDEIHEWIERRKAMRAGK